jgi:hypothetical protein
MYCPRCGKLLPDDAAFCLSCGNPTSHVRPSPPPVHSRSSNKGVWIVGGIFITLILVVLSLHQPKYFDDGRPLPQPARPLAPSMLVTVPHAQKLFSGSIAVNPHSMYWVGFTVDPRMKNVIVSGHFQAYGGTANDTQTVICSEEDFINFRNGHQTQVFYNSGKTTAGNVSTVSSFSSSVSWLVVRFTQLSPEFPELRVMVE